MSSSPVFVLCWAGVLTIGAYWFSVRWRTAWKQYVFVNDVDVGLEIPDQDFAGFLGENFRLFAGTVVFGSLMVGLILTGHGDEAKMENVDFQGSSGEVKLVPDEGCDCDVSDVTPCEQDAGMSETSKSVREDIRGLREGFRYDIMKRNSGDSNEDEVE